MEQKTCSSSEVLELDLTSGGGFVAQFSIK
jgi:hypothetical protein